jgi:peptidyl-prolyl cis-trans isomerase B (cyclophilin B)
MLSVATIAAMSVAAAEPPPISPDRLYVGVDGPVPVTVAEADPGRVLSLALMDAEGALLAPVRQVAPGRLDVSLVMPEILQVRRTCFLQCLHGAAPVGSALVIQPLLSPPRPRTEQTVRPDGSVYTRITGWSPPPDERAEPEPEAEPETQAEPETEAEGAAEPQPRRTFSGLRVYLERDVALRTTLGDIVLALRPDEAPNTAWNFRQLVAGGFYDGVIFHRIVPLTRDGEPFVIQSGDPSGTGDGGPGYALPLEPSRLPHDFGVISMARGDDPDSAGSQFFICLSRAGTARLDGQYCAFGCAVAGASTIRSIAGVELADVATGRPVDPPVVVRAELVPSPPRSTGSGRPDHPVIDDGVPVEAQIGRIPR